MRGLPDEELWTIRQFLKRRLLGAILERAQTGWAKGRVTAQQVVDPVLSVCNHPHPYGYGHGRHGSFGGRRSGVHRVR